ncbi:hypothetical protein [Variovorax sp. LT1R16]|uniref:hypothetical protein n=1 Tax=Variovorax sp. LT1R16 TaxID=3443728 RepID=UPI003F477F63
MPADTALTLKDAIGLAADVMTLFGVSGFFTWSFIQKSMEARSPADVGVTVFALSVKVFISFFAVLLLAVPAGALQVFVIMLYSGYFGPGDGFWNQQKATAYLFGYVLNALWFLPAAVLTVASIVTWSTEPFRRFARSFVGARRTGQLN